MSTKEHCHAQEPSDSVIRLNVKSGFAPLHVATFLGHKEVAERLRKYGAVELTNPGDELRAIKRYLAKQTSGLLWLF